MEGNDLALQFLADLYRRTDIQSEEAFQKALQAFADELIPWVNPHDLPSLPRDLFTMFDRVEISDDEAIHHVTFIGKYLSRLRKLNHVIAPKEGFETQLRASRLPLPFGMSALGMTR